MRSVGRPRPAVQPRSGATSGVRDSSEQPSLAPHQALRALGNRLVGILHSCLRHHTAFSEDTAWAHPQIAQAACKLRPWDVSRCRFFSRTPGGRLLGRAARRDRHKAPPPSRYNQYHLSATDHGFWPATTKVGTIVPPSWPIDGLTEVRFPSMGSALRVPIHMREVFLDEQNVFEHCIGQLTGPGGGRCWTTGHDDSVGHPTVLLVRRRRGVSGRAFRSFIHTRLGPILHAAGAQDLRTYTFLPLAPRAHTTFGVSHDNPPHRRYHGAVIFGTGTRGEVEDMLGTAEVAAVVDDLQSTCTAIHAFAVGRTVPVIRSDQA